ncbi:hypothetical protein [Paenibacillus sp. M2]|uniref:hypothetical protein n=1 Tax=Paenibacillus sp. M2 TaxID=3341793 RepID=UPI0039897CD5
MFPSKEFQERIDRLALFYIEKKHDVSTLTEAQFLELFNKTCNKLIDAVNGKHQD